jgi:hypothetical protein
MKEHKLVHVFVSAGTVYDAREKTEIDVFADGWTIQQMVALGPDGKVLLLMERNKPGRSGSGEMPW